MLDVFSAGILTNVGGWLLKQISSRVVDRGTDRVLENLGLFDVTCTYCRTMQRSLAVPEKQEIALTCPSCHRSGIVYVESLSSLVIHEVHRAEITIRNANIYVHGTTAVPHGEEFIAQATAFIQMPDFVFPPDAVMLSIYTQKPLGGIAGYTLQAWLLSDAFGQRIEIGDNFHYWISKNHDTGEECGIFGYNGLLEGFRFPSDPEFFGRNPETATFSVLFRNTGLPFYFLESPKRSICVNIDSGDCRWAVETAVKFTPGARTF